MLARFRDKKVDRDWLNTTFPCMMACPAQTNAGRYVALIAEGKFEEAYHVARDPNPMASVCGRVCAHPCETACRRGAIDKPIAIRALKRFLTERYGPESRHPLEPVRRVVEKLPYRVAIIGSGPVGLSAAHDLALMGYTVTIFEAAPLAGGMLCLGIPEYRLPRSVVEAQVREILDLGNITLKLNHAAGRDFTVAGLRREGFDAVVIAVGAHRSRDLSIPGIDLDGVLKGIDFLLNSNLGYRFSIGKRVVVIGGGNVAMDVARSAAREVLKQHAGGPQENLPSEESIAAVAAHEMVDVSLSALRMGAREVNIVCLEPRDEMPAALEEIEEAETEGIRVHAGYGPKQAIGQTAKLEFLSDEDGVQVSPRGLIVADPKSLATTAPGIFAGGDCVFGPRLIIDSVGDGKRIAIGIDEYLRGVRHPDPEIEVEVLDRHQMLPGYLNFSRQPVPMLPLDRRTGMTEVEIGYDEAGAMQEAQRCLRCWINTVFEGNDDDGSRCILCGGCVDVCPENCLKLVPLEQIDFPPATLEHIQSNVELYTVELDDVAASELGVITGSAMLKDETKCIRCGLCVARCPVNVITMESYHWVVKSPTKQQRHNPPPDASENRPRLPRRGRMRRSRIRLRVPLPQRLV